MTSRTTKRPHVYQMQVGTFLNPILGQYQNRLVEIEAPNRIALIAKMIVIAIKAERRGDA